jgi:tol-pal system-associated acyl-CoA thioesterase
MQTHHHTVQIYYEDTDLSGVVYHANYLKYFERAREHLLGPDKLVELWENDGVGFVVYKCEMTFKEGAKLGDTLDIRTQVTMESAYRAIFDQKVYRQGSDKVMVEGIVQLVCVDAEQKLVAIPKVVTALSQSES